MFVFWGRAKTWECSYSNEESHSSLLFLLVSCFPTSLLLWGFFWSFSHLHAFRIGGLSSAKPEKGKRDKTGNFPLYSLSAVFISVSLQTVIRWSPPWTSYKSMNWLSVVSLSQTLCLAWWASNWLAGTKFRMPLDLVGFSMTCDTDISAFQLGIQTRTESYRSKY